MADYEQITLLREIAAQTAGQVRRASATIVFDGGTEGGIGETDAVDTVFVTTGSVEILRIVPFCLVDLAGASATLSLGVLSDPDSILGVTTATGIDADEYWLADTGSETPLTAVPAALKDIETSEDIVVETKTADITGGSIRFDVLWRPLTDDGELVGVE
jgi:hypothetical protein